MFICLSSAGKKEATAGRQNHGGRRGPGRLKILPQPHCPWKRSFFLERRLGRVLLSPLRGLTSSAKPRLRSRADGVSSTVCGPGPHCSGRPWNPHFSVWTAGGFTRFHPERLGLGGGAPTGQVSLAKLCAVGGRSAASLGADPHSLAEVGLGIWGDRGSFPAEDASNTPIPSQRAFSGCRVNARRS